MLILPQNSPEDAHLAQKLSALQKRIATAAAAAGRNVDSVTLLAVSKGHGITPIRQTAHLGVEHFGESYVAEALPKIEALAGLELTWHFIGRIQANKTRDVATWFHWVHGIDRVRIAARLSVQRPHFAPPLNVCIQVSLAGEKRKAGVAPADVVTLAAEIVQLPGLRLRGLMCILPESLDARAQGEQFAQLAALLDSLRTALPAARVDTLSMGMSGDFEPAIAAGSTIVRIGTALFGPRPPPPPVS